MRASEPGRARLYAVTERIHGDTAVSDLFQRLSGGGREPGSVLLESGEIAPTYAEQSIGVFRPSVCAAGKDGRFRIRALDPRGERLLEAIAPRLPGGTPAARARDTLEGCLEPDLSRVSFEERLRAPGPMGILRALLFDCVTSEEDARLPLGIFGCFAYEFVRSFEPVPAPRSDPLGEPDYLFYLATRLFVTDHRRRTTTLVSLIPDGEPISEARADLDRMRAAAEAGPLPTAEHGSCGAGPFESDTPPGEFHAGVRSLKEAVAEGRVFQTVYGRTLSAPFHGEPFAAYLSLKTCNPSPYLFYLRDERGALLGASPELAVRVAREDDGRLAVELRPIAGTKPRGLVDGRIVPALDERLEAALKIDAKELAEHTMLIDLARNDVASVSEPGTTRVVKSFAVEKYSHVQHLVSTVRGALRRGLDALDAYLATMNMGTLTGAPKPEAMRLIARLEGSARGFFGGAVGFVTHQGEMETAIVIRSMRILEDRVHVRAGAGIVADSIPEQEWIETERKARACILALEEGDHAAPRP